MPNKNLLKTKAFWITFFSYAIIHALRMCYSFNKVNLKREFQLTDFHLGCLDTLLYLSYGVGVIFRYEIFEGNESMKKVFFITSMLISCSFGAIAYIGLFFESTIIGVEIAQILVTLGVIGYGFFHMSVYQICGSIVSGYYHPEKESHKLGFWGSSSSVGNILGFLLSNLLIHELELKWEVSVLLFSILNLMMTFVFYYWVEMPTEDDETYKLQLYLIDKESDVNNEDSVIKDVNLTKHEYEKVNNNNKTLEDNKYEKLEEYYQEQEIRAIHWLHFIKRTISTSREAKFTYMAYIMIKATVYTFLMWFPIFLVSKRLEHVSGYISTLFDIGGTLGGYLIGKLHKINYHASEQSQSENHEHESQSDYENGTDNLHYLGNGNNNNSRLVDCLLKYRNVFFIVCITLLILAFILVDGSLLTYCPLTLMMGFFLSGTYNNISSHEIFKIAKGKVLLTDMLLNLSVGISTIMIGLVQLMTAFMLKWNRKDTIINILESEAENHKNSDENTVNYGSVFIVLLVMMGICILVMIKRVFVLEERKCEKSSKNEHIK